MHDDLRATLLALHTTLAELHDNLRDIAQREEHGLDYDVLDALDALQAAQEAASKASDARDPERRRRRSRRSDAFERGLCSDPDFIDW